MRTLYIDCGMGAAGDMLTASLLELIPESERDEMLARLNALGIPHVEYRPERIQKCGIMGTHMSVLVDGHEEHEHHHDHEESGHHHEHSHHHASMTDIEHIIDGLDVSDKVRQDVLAVYGLIAEAESHAHGRPVTEIHFHEVGTIDAVADITAVCLLMEYLAPAQVIASPVHTGSGSVHCAHGILPVPAPATAYILRDIPVYSDGTVGELTTPTGAALLAHFVTEFAPMPQMKVSAIGYGCGRKDFSKANVVRTMLGESDDTGYDVRFSHEHEHEPDHIHSPGNEDDHAHNCDQKQGHPHTHGHGHDCDNAYHKEHGHDDHHTHPHGHGSGVLVLECNIDDMTGEEMGYAMEQLLAAGARDVFTQSVMMKKSRPGIMLTVICDVEQRELMVERIFALTTTIGIREYVCARHVLERRIETVDTPSGPIHRKISEGYGVRREKYEYDDLASLARETGRDIRTVAREIDLMGK